MLSIAWYLSLTTTPATVVQTRKDGHTLTIMAERMFTTAQAAVELGLGVDAIRKRIKDKRLKATKDGKEYKIAESEIERYKRERT